MPTLAESFPTVRSALVEHFALAPAGIDRETPFEAMIRVLLDREFGASRAALALEVLERAGLLTPDRLAQADVLAVRDAFLQAAIPATPQSVAPLSNLARWIVRASRCAGRFSFQPRSIDRLAAWRARGNSRHRPGHRRRDRALRPETTIVSGRPGDISGARCVTAGSTRAPATTKLANCWSARRSSQETFLRARPPTG